MSRAIVILTSVPDLLTAKRIAHNLVEHKLAACVHINSGGLSVYEWQGTLCADEESQLIIKTTQSNEEACFEAIRKSHPYEVPEIISLATIGGDASYLNWINQQCDG